MSELEALLDALAERIADRVVQRLSSGRLEGFIDQSASPLGRRRHIAAIRSGALPGIQVGRRYLARREDVERFVGQPPSLVREVDVDDRVDRLASELGFVGKKKRK